MDDTNEAYVESMFKAFRHIGEQEKALAFLLSRNDKYQKRSSYPAQSLFEVYQALDQENEGFTVLEKTLIQHASSPEFIIFYLKKLLNYGKLSTFDHTFSEFSNVLSTQQQDKMQALKNENQGEIEQALFYYEREFNQKPYIIESANRYFSLLNRTHSSQKLDEILNNLADKHPKNTTILSYVAQWHSNLETQLQAQKIHVDVQPNNAYQESILAEKLTALSQYSEAIDVLNHLIKEQPKQAANYAQRAQVHYKISHFSQAQMDAKQALCLDIDNEHAFNVLLSCAASKDDKMSMLEFIDNEMGEQCTYGNAIWNYWYEAKVLLKPAELKAFIDKIVSKYSDLWCSFGVATQYYIHTAQYELAKDIINESKKRFSLLARTYYDSAQLNILIDDKQQAISDLNRALQLNPYWDTAAQELSQLHEKEGQFESAKNVLIRALKYDNSNGVLFGMLADMQYQLGDKQQAIESLCHAVKSMSNYDWAWQNLITWGAEIGKDDIAQSTASSISKQYPYLASSWCNLAFIEQDNEQKQQYYFDAIAVDPACINSHKKLAQLYISRGKYAEALDLIEHTQWHKNLPFELCWIQAELFELIGNISEAIDTLYPRLEQGLGSPNHWRQLYQWLAELKNHKKLIKYSYQQLDLNPHQPGTLCVVAENFLRFGKDKEQQQAPQLLEKAFYLSPNDEYIGLTYIDALIDKQQYQAAYKALIALKEFSNNHFVWAREIKLLTHLDQLDEARTLFGQLFTKHVDDYWTYNYSYQALLEQNCSVNELLSEIEAKLESLNKVAANFWAEKFISLERKNHKKIVQILDKTLNLDTWQGICGAYLEYCSNEERCPDNLFFESYKEKIAQDMQLVGQLGYLYLCNEHYYIACRLYERAKLDENSPSYALYHYILCLQLCKKWQQAGQVFSIVEKSSPDNCYPSLQVWRSYHQFLQQLPIEHKDLSLINFDELTHIEKYIHRLLQVIVKLGGQTLDSAKGELSPLLRACQREYQAISGSLMAVHAKKSVRAYLVDSIEDQGWFKKVKTKFWLSNHF